MPVKKRAGIILVIVALTLSAYLTFVKSTRGGLELAAIQRDQRDLSQHLEVPEEMVSLTDMYRTINFIQKRYIDTARIDPRAMFVGAMRAIESSSARGNVAPQHCHSGSSCSVSPNAFATARPERSYPCALVESVQPG